MAASPPASPTSVFSHSPTRCATLLFISVLKMITESERDALPFVHKHTHIFYSSIWFLTVLGISVCPPWNVIVISVLEIVWPQRNPTSNLRECHSNTHTGGTWRLDSLCANAAITNNTLIYGKSPLNATQNEFNNESNIKIVICYASDDRRYGWMWARCAYSSLCSAFDCLFLFVRSIQVNWFVAKRRIRWTSQAYMRYKCVCVRRKAILDNDNADGIPLCLRFRYECDKKKPTECETSSVRLHKD